MHQRTASIVLLTTLAVISSNTARGAAGEPDPQQKTEPAKKKTEQASSLTGCVDQQDGQYVLVDDRSLSPIADLIAEGFPTEGFAKHMGHKVTVRGTANPGGSRTVIKVRSIETLSETCTPQQQGKY
jgi:hypothetical protein